jgi:hypothetical protein
MAYLHSASLASWLLRERVKRPRLSRCLGGLCAALLTCLDCLALWRAAAHAINFRFVPTSQRLLYINSIQVRRVPWAAGEAKWHGWAR